MCFDDPIYLDHESFDDLVEDTEQCRICWMYHDILSDIKIAGMFARYAGSGAPTGEARTAVAWVAAGREENSFYLLFKWYDDFCSPPERGDLYYVEREQGPDGEVRVRQLNLDFQNQLGPQGQAWCRSLWTKVSANTSRFFGDSEFETSPIGRILRLLDDSPGQELDVFDWYLGRKSDGEKAAQCATIAAYFWGIQSIEEIIYHIVVTDGGENAVHYLHTRDFLEILGRLSGTVDMKRLSELGGVFQELADGFCRQPVRSPTLSRSAGRALTTLTESGEIRWLRLTGQGRRKLLRELYCRCAPRQVWDVFHPWQGELYYTVLRRPPVRGLYRGVYLLSRFEDQRGMDITDLFWLEHVAGGVIHLCEGEFFEELLDLLLTRPAGEIVLHGGRRRSEDLAATYAGLLKEAYDKLDRSLPQGRGGQRDRIY